jgi:hypothetical protein
MFALLAFKVEEVVFLGLKETIFNDFFDDFTTVQSEHVVLMQSNRNVT